MGYKKDITGMRFGKWSVLGYSGANVAGINFWVCKCDCGIEKILAGSELNLGRTQGCRSCSARRQGRNTYKLVGQRGICTVASGQRFIFDRDDYSMIKKYTWYVDKHGYVRTKIHSKTVLLHRLLASPPDNMQVDHINLDPSDNRKSNLRHATNQQNVCNQPTDRENTSGYKGVSWHKMRRKWASQIHVHGKHISLGLYANIQDAARAYNKAAIHYFGEFARINKLPNEHTTLSTRPNTQHSNIRKMDQALEQSGAFL